MGCACSTSSTTVAPVPSVSTKSPSYGKKRRDFAPREDPLLGLKYNELYDSCHEFIESVSENRDLASIGGSVVKKTFEEAKRLATRKKWSAAIRVLTKTLENATLVQERAPYIVARREHEDKIKAYMSIEFLQIPYSKPYGELLKDIWKESLEYVGLGDYEAAKGSIDEAVKLIKEIDQNEYLQTEQTKVKSAREENQKEIDKIKQKMPLDSDSQDLVTLIELTKIELRLAKEAAKLGDDPGKPSRVPFDENKRDNIEDLFKAFDWFKLKAKLHDSEDEQVTVDVMWDLWRYRQKYVTEFIDELRIEYPGLIAKASGSTDMESDIDITFASAYQDGMEINAARDFNQEIIRKFGKSPGRVFDVNIYPRDYNAIKESFNPDFNLEPLIDVDIDHPEDRDMKRMSQIDMDVSTLMKQRRFMDQSSFNQLLDSVVEGIESDELGVNVRDRYEEGEDIYLLTSIEKIDAILEKLATDSKLPTSGTIKDQIDLYLSLKEPTRSSLSRKTQRSQIKGYVKMQLLIPQLLEGLENAFEDEVMEVTDSLYLDRMAELRRVQAFIRVLENEHLPVESHHPGETCNEKHADVDHSEWLSGAIDGTKARIIRQQYENIIFANEAYVSQGAIEHIVAGAQARKKDPEKAAEILRGLTPQTIAQSFNEQFADFSKDLEHAGRELKKTDDGTLRRKITGEAFVHASKYLSRLLDAAQLMVDKIDGLTFKLTGDRPEDLKEEVEKVLLALRKSAELSAEVKAEIGISEVKRLFNVETIDGFHSKILEFNKEFNIKVRSSEAFQAEQSVLPKTNTQYFEATDIV